MSESVRPSRSRDFALTFGSSQLLALITSVVGLVATPFLFRWLGPDRLGAWRVIESWVAYLGVLPTCLALATVFRLSQLLDQGDRECTNRYLTTAAVVFTVVAAAIVVVGAAAAPIVPRLVSAPDELEGELVTAYLLVVGGAALTPLGLPRLLLQAAQKGYVVNSTQLVGSLALTGSGLALAYHRAGLPGQAAAVLIGTVVSLALQAAAVWRTMPWAGRGLLDRSAARGLLAATTGLLLAGSLGTIGARAEILAVNWTAGATETARYDITRRAFTMVTALLGSVGTAAWVPLGQLYRTGNREGFARGLEGSFQLVMGLGLAAVLPLAAYLPQFIGLWMKGENVYDGDWAAAGFAVGTLALAIHTLQTWLLSSLRAPRDVLPSAGVYAAVSVIGTLGLGEVAGPAGVAWGYALGLLLCVGFNAWALRRLGVEPSPLVRAVAPAVALAVPFSAAVTCWAHTHTVFGWVGLLTELAAAGTLFLGLWLLLAVPRVTREDWVQRVRRLHPPPATPPDHDGPPADDRRRDDHQPATTPSI